MQLDFNRLTAWRGRPDFLGAYLDLVLDGRGQLWSEFELIERWKREWTPQKCKVWLKQAEELSLIERTPDGKRWQLAWNDEAPTVPEADTTPPPGASTESQRHEEMAGALADALIQRIPAFGDLEALAKAASRIHSDASGIEFECQALPSAEQLERSYITHVLDVVGGNKTSAAEILGIDMSTLYRKLSRWGIK